jgi:RHS repeat-associated protein
LGKVIIPNEVVGDIYYPFGNITKLSGDTSTYEDELFFYHNSHVFSVEMVTDINANVTQQVLYNPFGQIISSYNAYWHQGKIPDYTFSAMEFDEENSMYYFSARYYNPPTFISRDPLFEKKPWMSAYAYCANNPVNKVDPTGLYEKESQAQKAQAKAIKRYGRDNVGSIYQNAKGKYEFRISKTGFKQERGDNIPKNSDAHADGGTKVSNNLKLFFYNIINGASGGYHGYADNGQRQESRKGHDETESVDWTNLISHMPGYIEKPITFPPSPIIFIPREKDEKSPITGTNGSILYRRTIPVKGDPAFYGEPYRGSKDSIEQTEKVKTDPTRIYIGPLVDPLKK